MSQGRRNAVAESRPASPTALARGSIGRPENRWEERGIAGIAIGEQQPLMTMRQAAGSSFQQAANQPLTPLSLPTRHDELALRVDQCPFPLGLTLVVGIPMPLIADRQALPSLVMAGFSILAYFLLRPLHHPEIHPRQSCGRFQGTSLPQMLSYRDGSRLGHFCIPQRRVLPLAEPCSTALAAQ